MAIRVIDYWVNFSNIWKSKGRADINPSPPTSGFGYSFGTSFGV